MHLEHIPLLATARCFCSSAESFKGDQFFWGVMICAAPQRSGRWRVDKILVQDPVVGGVTPGNRRRRFHSEVYSRLPIEMSQPEYSRLQI